MSRERSYCPHHRADGSGREKDGFVRGLLPGITVGSFGATHAGGRLPLHHSCSRNPWVAGTGDQMTTPNKPDAANPAMTHRFHIGSHWRRVADLERSANNLLSLCFANDVTSERLRSTSPR